MRRETSSMLDVELKQILDKVALIKCFIKFAKVVLFDRPILLLLNKNIIRSVLTRACARMSTYILSLIVIF